MRLARRATSSFVILAFLGMAPANAAEQILSPPGSPMHTYFGSSVAVSGDWAIVGMPQDSTTVDDAGAAFIYRKIDGVWIEQQKLTPDAPQIDGYFGEAVDISGDYAVIGAPRNGSTGEAYVYHNDSGSWALQATLLGDNIGERFGSSVSVSLDWVLVGAPTDNTAGGTNVGAYFYSRSGTVWTRQARLQPNDMADYTRYGAAVTLFGFGYLAAVGAPGAGTSGAVYVLDRLGGSWQQQDKIVAVGVSEYAKYGESVAAMGTDYIVAGATWNTDSENHEGAVAIHHFDGEDWVQETLLSPDAPVSSGKFGTSVSVYSFRLVVGSVIGSLPGTYPGTVDAYSKLGSSWVHVGRRKATGVCDRGKYGSSVAMDLDDVIVGADEVNNYQGAAYTLGWSDMAAVFHDGFPCADTSTWSSTIPPAAR